MVKPICCGNKSDKERLVDFVYLKTENIDKNIQNISYNMEKLVDKICSFILKLENNEEKKCLS